VPTKLNKDVVDKEPHYTHASGTDIIQMLEVLIHNIFVVFVGFVFQQTVGIPMETNCAPLLSYAFLHRVASQEKSIEARLIRYIYVLYAYDVISLNNDISSRCMCIMRFLINNVLVELGGHIVNKSSAFP
jgi:hypothetical protein